MKLTEVYNMGIPVDDSEGNFSNSSLLAPPGGANNTQANLE